MKKALLSVTALIAVIAVVSACGKQKDTSYTEYVTDENGAYVTDENGEIVTTVLNADEVSVEYVTDENGKKTLDDKGEYITVLHYINNVEATDSNGKKVTVKKDVANTTISTDDPQSTGTTAETETAAPNGSVTQTNERIFESKYKPIIESGKFTIKMNYTGDLSGTGVSVPLVFAVDGSKIFVETKYNLIKMQFVYSGSKMYLVLPSIKSYCETDLDDEDMGDMGDISGEISDSISNSSAKYIQTTTVKISGKEYICEEYDYSGLTYKYYFTKSGKELSRIEMIDSSSDEGAVVINVSAFTAGASSSYFKVPSSYKKVDLDSLAGLV